MTGSTKPRNAPRGSIPAPPPRASPGTAALPAWTWAAPALPRYTLPAPPRSPREVGGDLLRRPTSLRRRNDPTAPVPPARGASLLHQLPPQKYERNSTVLLSKCTQQPMHPFFSVLKLHGATLPLAGQRGTEYPELCVCWVGRSLSNFALPFHHLQSPISSSPAFPTGGRCFVFTPPGPKMLEPYPETPMNSLIINSTSRSLCKLFLSSSQPHSHTPVQHKDSHLSVQVAGPGSCVSCL